MTTMEADTDTDRPGGAMHDRNPHRVTYRPDAFSTGVRGHAARTDRDYLARLRDHRREEATRVMRINLARSVGDPWGSLGTLAIDGIPGTGRAFGPFRFTPDRDGRAVDTGYRAAVLADAERRIRQHARAALARPGRLAVRSADALFSQAEAIRMAARRQSALHTLATMPVPERIREAVR
jgi:hypothetical protein